MQSLLSSWSGSSAAAVPVAARSQTTQLSPLPTIGPVKGAQWRCSRCGVQGHRANNTKFHPVDSGAADAPRPLAASLTHAAPEDKPLLVPFRTPDDQDQSPTSSLGSTFSAVSAASLSASSTLQTPAAPEVRDPGPAIRLEVKAPSIGKTLIFELCYCLGDPAAATVRFLREE